MTHSGSYFVPRLMLARQAAHYLGISEGTLRKAKLPRKTLGRLRLYDRLDLDHFASTLPIDGEDSDECDGRLIADQAFGCAT